MQAVQSLDTVRSPTNRARISNGTTPFLGAVDGRKALARRHRDLLVEFRNEFVDARGREPLASEKTRFSLMAGLTVRMEVLVAMQARGEDTGDELVRVANALRRERDELGLTAGDTAKDDAQAVQPSIDWAKMLGSEESA